MRIAPAIILSAEQRKQLEAWARSRRAPLRLAERARVGGHREGRSPTGTQAPHFGRAGGGDRTEDHARRSSPGHAVEHPRDGSRRGRERGHGATHLACPRSEAAANKDVQAPQRPAFAEKLQEIVGLYLNPPAHALVLSVDEKSQIQALDRTQPGLPLKPGRWATMTHDYKRNGTTTLFAALNTLNGRVVGTYMSRHTHREWLKFLQLLDEKTPVHKPLHVIADNYGTHKHPAVIRWLKRHPRFHLHFTPTGASWLNMIERFFRDLSSQRIRRGSFASVHELTAAIENCITQHNYKPKPFIWTAKASDILEKVKRPRATLNKL